MSGFRPAFTQSLSGVSFLSLNFSVRSIGQKINGQKTDPTCLLHYEHPPMQQMCHKLRKHLAMKTWLSILFATLIPSTLLAQVAPTREQAAAAQEKAVKFFASQVAVEGGYVYQVTSDLKLREGEGDAGANSVWVQPPGTPAVGLAMIEAYERTGEKHLLDAALAAARCLLRGQLHSGGWQNHIDFDPELRPKLAYRVDGKPAKKARNISSFDDDQTQAALRFLMHVDRALEFKDEPIHEAVQFGLEAVLKNQFPSGGWAQVFDDPVKLKERMSAAGTTAQRAGYPASWPRQYPGGDYWFFYTLNDQALVRVMQTMWLAGDIYNSPAYRDSALKAAEFLIAAQMPDPQPAWAQQYNYALEPVWARKFEPPSVSGGESQVVIEALLDLTIATGDKRYLAPIPKAIAYLKSCLLPDGRLARFYELKTNKPLYFTRDYKQTYADDDMPTHYGFKVDSRLERLESRFNQLTAMSADQLKQLNEKQQRSAKRSAVDADRVAKIMAAMDERGAWVEPGQLKYIKQSPKERPMIHSETFIKNLEVLSRFTGKD